VLLLNTCVERTNVLRQPVVQFVAHVREVSFNLPGDRCEAARSGHRPLQ
jgi:hypothetical protein